MKRRTQKRRKFKKIREELKKYIDEEIKKSTSRNFKKDVILILFSVILTAISTGFITYYFSERYIDITSAHKFMNDSVEITLYNNAKTKSTSTIRIYGKIDNEDKLLVLSEDKILRNDKELTFNIPLKKTYISNFIKKLDAIPTRGGGYVPRGELSIPAPKNLMSNYLFYRIECGGCQNKQEWSIIKPKELQYNMSMWYEEKDNKIYLDISYLHYEWET